MTKDINYSIEEIGRTAKMILSLNPSSKIFIFNGEMGSGKTTLIKAIMKELGYEGTVSSPTFSIINEYLKSNNSGRSCKMRSSGSTNSCIMIQSRKSFYVFEI